MEGGFCKGEKKTGGEVGIAKASGTLEESWVS